MPAARPNTPPAEGVRIQSLERGLAILEQVASAPEGLALAELARRLDLGKSTVHNLARTLVVTGYLAKRASPLRYVLGPGLFNLAGRQRTQALHERAAPILLTLARDYPGSAALLAESDGGEVRVSLRVDPADPRTVRRPLDRFSPPYANATSLLFLAWWDDETRRGHRARHPFWECAAHLWPDEAALDEELRLIRAQGHAVFARGRGPVLPVAVPIFSAGGELVAALGLAFHTGDKKPGAARQRALIARLRADAAKLAAHNNNDTNPATAP